MKKLLCGFFALWILCSVCLAHGEDQRIHINVSNMNNLIGFTMVSNMIENPGQYLGKRVKITGWYTEMKNKITGEMERSLIYVDFSSCCFNDGSVYLALLTDTPDDFQFPAVNQQSVLVGVVEKLQDGTDRGALRLESIELLDHWVEEVYW